MHTFIVVIGLIGFATLGYTIGRARAIITAGGVVKDLNSIPSYYGYYTAIWIGIPSLVMLIVWLIVEPHVIDGVVMSNLPINITQNLSTSEYGLLLNDIHNAANGSLFSKMNDRVIATAAKQLNSLRQTSFMLMLIAVFCVGISGLRFARNRISPDMRARNIVEKVINFILIISSLIAILTTMGIVVSLIFESVIFFSKIPLHEFLFGLNWSPQIAIHTEQVGSSGAFGAVPLFAGTLLITFIAMLVAVPIGLMSAIYMAEYAKARFRAFAKPMLEVLAGIPTVVYGFFAATTVAPAFRIAGQKSIGLDVSSESALAAGVVMGIMIIPFVSSLSDDVIKAVPQSLRDGSYGLGATKSETIRLVVMPAALPGIVGALLLAVSRAIGETMIVVMAAGLTSNLTVNPFEAVTTVTVQIVTLLVGDQEFDSPKTLSAFALGMVLFLITLALNVLALRVVRKYREHYE
ncbi:phosphate ABC transporter, permease protein PstC [Candidatus Endolissoclinum faulkneri L2]|uniref:Phosphate transport system permease protein n=1 Tax=Candidatus Endolissoclinum faulkneri L2 TaxID=1193729 RepID=K7YNX3_9PROT|nr:phosphate ABC transporter permease subunit PstC [Candidatus Endolissoclinum faulkneri]AFX99242.1 phosphate ABC transporter, permease protein PstC [Candidatus Endolissoclinum faulkneri L2]